jgi:hypothetical protein
MTDTNKLYTIFTHPEQEYTDATVQVRQWIAANGLDDCCFQIEAGPATDLNGNTHDYVTQFNLTTLPALVNIKKTENSDTLTCNTVATGLEAILALSAEQIGAMKAAYAETIKTPTNTKITARRIG